MDAENRGDYILREDVEREYMLKEDVRFGFMMLEDARSGFSWVWIAISFLLRGIYHEKENASYFEENVWAIALLISFFYGFIGARALTVRIRRTKENPNCGIKSSDYTWGMGIAYYAVLIVVAFFMVKSFL